MGLFDFLKAKKDTAATAKNRLQIIIAQERSSRGAPDYLPLLLEYASTRPLAEARQLLADIAPIVAALRERLSERRSTYAGVFAALLAIAGNAGAEPAELAAPADIDADWAEDPVAFGPEAAPGCSSDRTISRIRAARRDARGEETNHV